MAADTCHGILCGIPVFVSDNSREQADKGCGHDSARRWYFCRYQVAKEWTANSGVLSVIFLHSNLLYLCNQDVDASTAFGCSK